MSGPARDLLREMRDELRALRKLEEARRHTDDGTPLSRSEFCRVLGIDLKSTLQPLIAARQVKTVPWTRGEVRIPVSELRRLQRDGIPEVRAAAKKSGHASPAAGAEAAAEDIGEIPIE